LIYSFCDVILGRHITGLVCTCMGLTFGVEQ
jgi:hypothetical protein